MYQLKVLQKEHCEGVAALSREIFCEPESYKSAEIVEYFIESGIVVSWKGAVVGYGLVGVMKDEGEHRFFLISFGITETHRRKGLGKLLLQEIKRFFATTYSYFQHLYGDVPEKIFLHVRTNNEAAQRLYAAEGFQYVRKISDYYTEPDDDAYCMGWFATRQLMA
jgi:ribosomal protein S18 acetylase RimI-like enzyme